MYSSTKSRTRSLIGLSIECIFYIVFFSSHLSANYIQRSAYPVCIKIDTYCSRIERHVTSSWTIFIYFPFLIYAYIFSVADGLVMFWLFFFLVLLYEFFHTTFFTSFCAFTSAPFHFYFHNLLPMSLWWIWWLFCRSLRRWAYIDRPMSIPLLPRKASRYAEMKIKIYESIIDMKNDENGKGCRLFDFFLGKFYNQLLCYWEIIEPVWISYLDGYSFILFGYYMGQYNKKIYLSRRSAFRSRTRSNRLNIKLCIIFT